MGKAGLSPTAVDEFCAEGYKKTSAAAMAELVACLHQAVEGHEPLALNDVAKAPALESAKKAMAELGPASILAIPLSDGEETVGILVLVYNKPRAGRRTIWWCSRL